MTYSKILADQFIFNRKALKHHMKKLNKKSEKLRTEEEQLELKLCKEILQLANEKNNMVSLMVS